MPPPFELSTFQSILLSTDGTVTDLVRHYVGEDIHVTKLSQQTIEDDKPEALELSEKEQLLHREILLSGPSQHYLYAESYFVIGRMSEFLRKELLESNIPIGLLWQREKLETFREILGHQFENNQQLQEYFPDVVNVGSNSVEVLSRRYKVYHGGKVLGLITEKFPAQYFR